MTAADTSASGPTGTTTSADSCTFPDTAILITRFLSPDGVGEVVDFMPVAEGKATDRHRLVRLLRVVRGTMRFRMEIQPRFDYGRKPHKLELHDDGSAFPFPTTLP